MSLSRPARDIIVNAQVGSLGTLTEEEKPFVTLVTVAAIAPTEIILLLSGLAKHTMNLAQRPACSLLIVEPGGESGDPLAGSTDPQRSCHAFAAQRRNRGPCRLPGQTPIRLPVRRLRGFCVLSNPRRTGASGRRLWTDRNHRRERSVAGGDCGVKPKRP